MRTLGRADALGLARPPGGRRAAEPDQASAARELDRAADPAGVAAALSAALLEGWKALHAKHPNLAGETPARKAARRNEQALQLLLHLHVMQLAPPDAGVLG